MFKYLSIMFFIAISSYLFATQKDIPSSFDFGNPTFRNDFHQEKFPSNDIRSQPFNGAIEMCNFFQYLKDTYDIHIAIETGTCLGQTTMFLASLFEMTYTVEIVPDNYEKSKGFLKEYLNVQMYLGRSPEFLRLTLPSLIEQRIIFYLDAHWFNEWPLLDELKEISNTHRDNCIIVIDDFKVPGRRDIPYDSYEGHSCSYEYIREKLSEIYSEYSVYYLIPKDKKSRAKFVAIPTSWGTIPGGTPVKEDSKSSHRRH